MVATSCDLYAPRCATTVPQVRFHGSRGGVFIGHRPPGTPVTPCLKYNIIYYIEMNGQRSFTSVQTCHTHTLPLAGWCLCK